MWVSNDITGHATNNFWRSLEGVKVTAPRLGTQVLRRLWTWMAVSVTSKPDGGSQKLPFDTSSMLRHIVGSVPGALREFHEPRTKDPRIGNSTNWAKECVPKVAKKNWCHTCVTYNKKAIHRLKMLLMLLFPGVWRRFNNILRHAMLISNDKHATRTTNKIITF